MIFIDFSGTENKISKKELKKNDETLAPSSEVNPNLKKKMLISRLSDISKRRNKILKISHF